MMHSSNTRGDKNNIVRNIPSHVNPSERESGSIGIGAMIVFIALILVAAVASTVIISTIENLQQDNEDTSAEAVNQLANKVVMESAFVSFNGAADCTATLYQHAGFSGWSALYTVGDYSDVPNSAGGTFLDPDGDGVDEAVSDDATTIKVDDGCEIIMYNGNDFGSGGVPGGQTAWSARLGAGEHSLSDINEKARPQNCGGTSCNDQISSLKVLGFELELVMKLSSGSDNLIAGDISWAASCSDGTTASIDSENISHSGSSLIDGTNTLGQENNFIWSEEIETRMIFKVEATLRNCSPQIGDQIEMYVHVDGGASTYYLLNIRSLDRGNDLMFNS